MFICLRYSSRENDEPERKKKIEAKEINMSNNNNTILMKTRPFLALHVTRRAVAR